MRLILLVSAFILALSANLSAKVYYKVKFPNDFTVFGCGAKADTIWPEIQKLGNCNINVGVSVKDQVFYAPGTSCGKILRTWRIIWWCDYNKNTSVPTIIPNPSNTDVGPMAEGSDANKGFLEYVQVIKLLDNKAPVVINCPTNPLTFCDYSTNDPNQYGAACEGPVNLEVKATDACSKSNLMLSYRLFLDLDGDGSMETFLSSAATNAWPIETTTQGDTLCGKIKFPAGHGFPYGKHKIEWIVNDNCGNETLCKYEFIVKDCNPPTVICHHGLSVNIMQTGMITIWATDFIKDYFDNCTPKKDLKIGIQKKGAGTTFPTTNSVTFDCKEIGTQEVEVWALDANGLGGYCTTYIIVQDNMGICPPPNPPTGSIMTAQKMPLAGAKVWLKKGAEAWSTETDENGQYAFAQGLPGCNVSIAAELDKLDATGVNALDVVLAAAHGQGFATLPSPYQILAADVNHDGKLDAEDWNEMLKLILTQQVSFQKHASWMFVPESHKFNASGNPFASAVPEKIDLNFLNCYKNLAQNFVAIKTGDVDESADLTAFRGPGNSPYVFLAPQMKCHAGKEIRVPITTPMLSDLAAFQFTLDYSPKSLELLRIEPGMLPAEWVNNLPDEHLITAGWYNPATLHPEHKGANVRQTAFTLVFKVLQNGSLERLLKMSDAKTKAEGYSNDQVTQLAKLAFVTKTGGTTNDEHLTLYAPTPNPAVEQFQASFFLPEAGEVVFSLSDASGQIIKRESEQYPSGLHNRQMNASGHQGLLFLHVSSANGTAVQRILVRR